MRKRLFIIMLIVVLILIIPIPTGIARDGGTKTYTALTYKIVKWNHVYGEGEVFNETKVYLFPDNFLSLDDLIKREINN